MPVFSLDFPFYYNFFCILLGLFYAYFLYLKESEFITSKVTYFLFCLRTIFVAILSFLLLNPVVKSKILSSERPIVIIAKDNSKSIKENFNSELKFLNKSLEDFDVFLYSFSDKIYEGLSEKNDGLVTNYSRFFSGLENKFENRNVAALVMASDGCYNTGANPEYFSYDFPVYCIALGDTTIYKDVRIDNVLNNEIAFFGNTFPLEVSLASTQIVNEVSNIKVWNNGIVVHEEVIKFSKDINYDTYTILLTADNVGLQQYIIHVDVLEDEKNTINNTYKTYIDVIDTRYEILFLKDRSHPDLAAYKSVIEKNQNYKLDIRDVNDNIVFDKYNLVVIFGVNNIPTSIINSDLPLVVFNAFTIPYSLNIPFRFDLRGGVEEINAYKHPDFSKFSFSTELLRLVNDAPPLYTPFGIYNIEGNVDVVLGQKLQTVETNKPLILIQQIESRKIAYMLAEGWWKWKFYDYSLNNNNFAFDELFSKLTQYLLLIEDKSLFRIYFDNHYQQNNEVIFRASLFNESYELVNDREIVLGVVDEDGMVYDFQFSQQDNELVARLGVLDVGTYNFIATVQGTNMVKTGFFDVKEIQLEQLGLSANHQILSKISSLSSGKLLYPNAIDDLIEIIKDSNHNKKIIHHREELKNLINFPLILLILLIIVSIEWFTRKYNGLI